MIMMTEIFKGRKKFIILVGVLCVAILGGILLTNGVDKKEAFADLYNAKELIKYRSAYVGDNSNTVNLINKLPYGDLNKKVSLQTKTKPYGITADYDLKASKTNEQQLAQEFKNNAAVIFSLIQNVDSITFNVKLPDKNNVFKFERQELEEKAAKDLWSYSEDIKTFESFLQGVIFKVAVSPEKYTPAMSSTPGIKLLAVYEGNRNIQTVQYNTEKGTFITWDQSTGKITQEGKTVKLPYGKDVYWSSISAEEMPEQDEDKEAIVNITLLGKGEKQLCNRQIKIIQNEGYYEVQRDFGILTAISSSAKNPASIDMAVRSAILERASCYKSGDVSTEGHLILETRELEGSGSIEKLIKVYSICSVGQFGFENGVFTKVSGSGAIPTVITFSGDEVKGYSLLEYKEPEDGSGYAKSIKEMFPYELQGEAFNSQIYYAELAKQQELQAGEYLRKTGRTAKVTADHVEKTLANINVEASNKLFSGMGKYDSLINSCPYWLGTLEKVEDGIRYIYKTSQDKTDDGYDLIVFTKAKEDGTVVKEVKYKIIGSKIEQIE